MENFLEIKLGNKIFSTRQIPDKIFTTPLILKHSSYNFSDFQNKIFSCSEKKSYLNALDFN